MPNTYLPGVVFIPSSLVMTAITQETQAVITCVVNSVTESNNYIPGMLVRLFIPSSYGMQQAANATVQIVSVNGLSFTVNMNSIGFDPFAVPASGYPQPASMAPAGSQNLQYDNTTNQVAFQPLNNQGN